MATPATADASLNVRPPLPTGVRVKLSIMMLLQYAIWGSWLPLIYPYLTRHLHFKDVDAGLMIAIGAVGALFAPFVAGQLADRYFSTERFLAVSHLLGAVLVWQLANPALTAEINDEGVLEGKFWPLAVFSFFYSFLYTPTLSLTNSLAFHHLPDRDRDFGRVRVWGTIGWIAAGIGVAQWLFYYHTPSGQDVTPQMKLAAQFSGMADAFRLSAILGVIMGVYCLFLPHTPPQRSITGKFAAGKALRAAMHNPLLTLFLISFPISCIHQFYFVHTSGFLAQLQAEAPQAEKFAEKLTSVFGVGGGGLMTIGQISEMVVLAVLPFFIKRFSRKALLAVGLLAYIARFAIFAYVPHIEAVVPALALHGLCFGCFFFIAFMVVDEETAHDVRASAQSLYNLIAMGFGIIAGNYVAGQVAKRVLVNEKLDYTQLFAIPMWAAIACLAVLLLFYPNRSRHRLEAVS